MKRVLSQHKSFCKRKKTNIEHMFIRGVVNSWLESCVPVFTTRSSGPLIFNETQLIQTTKSKNNIMKNWSCGESNPVPLACEASALPYELQPHVEMFGFLIYIL